MTEKTSDMLGTQSAAGKDDERVKEMSSTNCGSAKEDPGDNDTKEEASASKMDETKNLFIDSRETPREVDLFSEDNVEEILDTIDNLRAAVEQLQVHCEKLAAEKSKLEQALIDKERHHQATNNRFQEELRYLRKVNLQLVQASKNSSG